jgi:hypothetical protein
MKCECIGESLWFCIDDSFGENTEIKGGEFKYSVGNIYEFMVSDGPFGPCYMVQHDTHGPIGFHEKMFNDTFIILN